MSTSRGFYEELQVKGEPHRFAHMETCDTSQQQAIGKALLEPSHQQSDSRQSYALGVYIRQALAAFCVIAACLEMCLLRAVDHTQSCQVAPR